MAGGHAARGCPAAGRAWAPHPSLHCSREIACPSPKDSLTAPFLQTGPLRMKVRVFSHPREPIPWCTPDLQLRRHPDTRGPPTCVWTKTSSPWCHRGGRAADRRASTPRGGAERKGPREGVRGRLSRQLDRLPPAQQHVPDCGGRPARHSCRLSPVASARTVAGCPGTPPVLPLAWQGGPAGDGVDCCVDSWNRARGRPRAGRGSPPKEGTASVRACAGECEGRLLGLPPRPEPPAHAVSQHHCSCS